MKQKAGAAAHGPLPAHAIAHERPRPHALYKHRVLFVYLKLQKLDVDNV